MSDRPSSAPVPGPPLARAPDFVSSLARGLEVLRAFGPESPAMTLSEVARRVGISRAAARRFLLTLSALGYVAAEGRLFHLTPKVLSLGYAYLSSTNVWDAAQPVLAELSEKVHESCSVSVLDGTEIVYVARVPTKRIMSVALSIGTRLPAHATSMGRMMLASLPADALDAYFAAARLERLTEHTLTDEAALRRILKKVARDGYALIDQELELGVRSIAVPVRNGEGRVIAAMNIGAHASRASAARMLEEFLPLLRLAAQRVSAALPH